MDESSLFHDVFKKIDEEVLSKFGEEWEVEKGLIERCIVNGRGDNIILKNKRTLKTESVTVLSRKKHCEISGDLVEKLIIKDNRHQDKMFENYTTYSYVNEINHAIQVKRTQNSY